ncbi:hypothetical protein SAMN02745248_01202 [Hathewaya proteolytica DSM 3090]|uniref:Uncharacterized protein n=1 Tax=Hathewaya proteolytica DSM 3090 TaxID=1121331 RepID=A0A1M6MWT8_9CLOT|nr:hypothetical protein SAMN02745248_01202 [Hathewaya proteolytica DSM 3090]
MDYWENDLNLNNYLKIGDNYSDIVSKLSLDSTEFDKEDIKQKLTYFFDDTVYDNYNRIESISTKDKDKLPVTMVLLFNDNILNRISYVYMTAD